MRKIWIFYVASEPKEARLLLEEVSFFCWRFSLLVSGEWKWKLAQKLCGFVFLQTSYGLDNKVDDVSQGTKGSGDETLGKWNGSKKLGHNSMMPLYTFEFLVINDLRAHAFKDLVRKMLISTRNLSRIQRVASACVHQRCCKTTLLLSQSSLFPLIPCYRCYYFEFSSS